MEMKSVIEKFKDIVIQIGTPYSVGTGFFLKEEKIIVTNEHVVRDNKEVTIDGRHFKKRTARVLFVDPLYDLAFLECDDVLLEQTVSIECCQEGAVKQGDIVVAVGHPFGYEYSATQGIISNTKHTEHDIHYLQHDAALNPGNSGGPLINGEGKIIGVNNFIVKDGNSMGFSLPVSYLTSSLREFKEGGGQIGAKCASCSNLVFESIIDKNYCPHCGSGIKLPSQEEEYQPSGIAQTIESFINLLGHDVKLSRMGPSHWIVKEGSADIKLLYSEREGMIFGDAYLCQLPKQDIAPIYEYMLKQNMELEGLCLSVPAKSKDIVLSLFIYDKYLNEQTGRELFMNLFKKADYYDNVFIEEYGAVPKDDWVDE